MTITVLGTPAPQGSKEFKGMSRTGHAIMVDDCKRLKPWRESVVWAVREARARDIFNGWFECPIRVGVDFYLPRPKSAPKRIIRPVRKPDLDKLVRGVFDALTIAGLIEDDARVVSLRTDKWFCGPDAALDVPGAVITVEAI